MYFNQELTELLVSIIDFPLYTLILAVPDKVCYIITKSLVTTGEIPMDWTKGVINVITKDGDLLSPSNWRPITQTPIFAKILEKIVHVRLLNYFLDNNNYIV